MTGRRERYTIFLRPTTAAALEEYAEEHRDRLSSLSQAADELLHRALTRELSAAAEDLLAPALRRVVRETVREEVADLVRGAGREQTDRLASLLAKAVIQAGVARHLARELLLRETLDSIARAGVGTGDADDEAAEEVAEIERAARTRAVAELRRRGEPR